METGIIESYNICKGSYTIEFVLFSTPKREKGKKGKSHIEKCT